MKGGNWMTAAFAAAGCAAMCVVALLVNFGAANGLGSVQRPGSPAPKEGPNALVK
jgi:hypothetical protein